MSSELILAVPSKGRLQENAQAFFARAGLDLVQARGTREYRGTVAGLDGVEVAYLSASEIARELAAGNVHLGVTGADLLHEQVADAQERLVFVMELGFGRANVVVAVPQAWIDVATMADLDDVAAAFRQRHERRLRVATKYVNLTRRFFAAHGIADYRIVESLGATEGAPAAGVAEAIVDITTTGATLAANALKILDDGVMLESMANLVAAPTAGWSAVGRAQLKTMLDRVAAERRARTVREVRFTDGSPQLIAEAASRFEAAAPFASGPPGVLHVPAGRAFALVDWLREQGAGTVTVARLDYVFEEDSALWSAVEGRLGGIQFPA